MRTGHTGVMRWNVAVAGGEVPVEADERTGGTVVILAHGAGSNMDSKNILWLASLIEQAGARVARFNFLYRAQGKSMVDRMPVSVATYRSVIDDVRQRLSPDRLIIGGHSYGGRVASMLEAEGKTADGLLLCSYPLHPPGQPEKLRDEHLPKIQTPTLQLSGTDDEFCTRSIMEDVAARLDSTMFELHWIEGVGHSYSVRKGSGRTSKDVAAEMTEAVRLWLNQIENRSL